MKIIAVIPLLCSFAAFGETISTNAVPPVALTFGPALFDSSSSNALPVWIRAAGYELGDVGGEPPAWHGAASLPEGKGMVWLDLDRTAMNENLALTLLHSEDAAADLAIQLWDDQKRVVALDLFKNALAVSAEARTDTFILPLRQYPSATRIVLRRISGDVKLYGAVLMPVVTAQDSDLDMMLETARRLGDPVSPEGDLMRRIAAARRTASSNPIASPMELATRTPIVPNVVQSVVPPPTLKPPVPFSYAGLEWLGLRTDFAVTNDTITPLPRARAGFDYGHCGHGRFPTAVTGIGSEKWRDYSIEMDVASAGVNPALNPHGLNPAYSGFIVLFRVADFKESWNDPGVSDCGFYVRNEGSDLSWGVYGARNHYSKSPSGWFNVYDAGNFEIAKGNGLKLDREKGNHVRVDVKADHIQIWFDGKLVCDVIEQRLHETFDGAKLDHGGFGVSWGFDTMGWVRNIKARPITATDADRAPDTLPNVEAGGLSWHSAGDFPIACGMSAGTFADGRIYVLGGYNGMWLSQVHSFDPTKPEQGWRKEINMPVSRACLAAVTANGKIYSIGGFQDNFSPPQSEVYSYDPRQPGQGWLSVSNLPVRLQRLAAVVVKDKIYAIGGIATQGVQSAVYEYDTAYPSEGWRHLNDLPAPRNSLAATVLDGKIYVIGGGDDHEAQSTVFVFDPSHQEQGWKSLSNLPAPRYALAVVSANGKIYAIGGFDGPRPGVTTVYVYNPAKPDQGWLNASNLPAIKGEAPAVFVNGKIIVITGADQPCRYQPTVFEASFQ